MGRIRSLLALTLLLAASQAAWSQNIVTETIPADPVTDWADPNFWETMDGQPVEKSWEFSDGEVRLARPRGGKNSLLSGPLPANFELSWKWKIEAKTNTGLKYRVRKFGSRWLGVEYQIIDEPTDKPSGDKGSTASIYDLVGPDPATKQLNPAGEWNAARVVAVGNRLEHYLNGVLVTASPTKGPIWDVHYAKSKFWGAEGFGKPGQLDRIMLTDHGGRAVYKDFKFVAKQAPNEKELELKPPFLGNAIRNSWADENSIVIWTRTTSRPEMNADGLEFVSISKGDTGKMARMNDADQLLSMQLPEGATLDQMLGACPGAAGEVRLTYFPGTQRKAMKSTDWVTTSADSDFTAQWKLEDLKANRQYAVVVEARPIGSDEPTAVIRGAFRTAPDAKTGQKFSFAMTTCHDFIRRDNGMSGHKIYPTLLELKPDFIVHAGDIEYYDKPDPWAMTIELMRFKWARIFSLPINREFYQQTTSYFLKDDHDTLKNDCWAGQTYGAVTFEQGVELFNHEQFPSHQPRYKTVRWGRDVQIWFLEGRDYRSPNNMPDGPDKTILGDEQKAWLYSTLDESDATFKLIFSPTPVVGPDRTNKKDNHANAVFAHEGEELRQAFSEREGVIVFCGDRHWQYASVDAETGLWEFGCGPGSEKHGLGWKPGDKRPVHQFLRVKGGFLTGELTYKNGKGKQREPRLTIYHRKVTGEQVSEFVFPEPDEK